MKKKLVNPKAGALAAGMMAVASYVQACYTSGVATCATAGTPIDQVIFINTPLVATTTLTAATDWTLPFAQTSTSGYPTISTTHVNCAGKATYSYNSNPETATWWEAGASDTGYHKFTDLNGTSANVPWLSASCTT